MLFFCYNKKDYCANPANCDNCDVFVFGKGGKVVSSNADRIRAMNDEELAKFLECFGLCHHCTEHHRLGDLRIYADEKCDEMCKYHCLEWLQQPAEVDNG